MTIPSFNSRTTLFKFNERYDVNQSNESMLYHQILREGVWKHGTDVIFVPRVLNSPEETFGEFLAYQLSHGYPYRFFVEEVEQWGGMGDTYAKFGIRVTDQMTCYIPKEDMRVVNQDGSVGELVYPKKGDLVYHVPSQKLFEIAHNEPESHPNFYLFGNQTLVWKFTCTLYSYDHGEVVDDGTLPPGLLELSMESEEKDFAATNEKYEQGAATTIDKTEVDPIFG